MAWGRNLEIIFSYLGLSMHILKVVLHDEVTFLHNVKSRAILNQKKIVLGCKNIIQLPTYYKKKLKTVGTGNFCYFFYRKFKWESELRKVRFYSCFWLTQCMLVAEWHKPSCTWKIVWVDLIRFVKKRPDSSLLGLYPWTHFCPEQIWLYIKWHQNNS